MDQKLKEFIHAQVSTTCGDADPDILTNYVLALLGESKPTADIKSNLKEKLHEFFEDETNGFIDRLYNYLDSHKPTSTDEGQHSTTRSSTRRDAEDEDDEEDGESSFKHRRHRSDDHNDSSGHSMHPSRQKRLLSHEDDFEGQNKSRRNYRSHRDDPEANDLTRGPSNYDRRGGGYNSHNGRPAWKNSRPMCKDYNEKGYCGRGDLCPYNHGKDTIVYEDKTPLNNPMMPPTNLPFNMPNMFDKDAFSPEKMATMQAAFPGMMPSPEDFMKMMMQQQPQQQFGQQQYGRGAGGPMRRGRGAGGRGRGRGGYGQQMGDRYNHNSQQPQRLSTTLVIDNIPPEKCQIIPINDYFKKFGNITNIQLHPRKALVQFSTRAEAEAAHASPDVIFDNRFVKVYWHKETTGDFRSGAGPAGPKSGNDDGKWKNQQQRDVDHGGDTSDTFAPTAPPPTSDGPDPTLVAAKAAELQKIRDVKLKKRQEQMKMILDLQKQKELLLQHQIDEQKKLLEKLNDKSLTQAQKEDLLRSLRKISSDIDTSKTNNTQTTSTPPGTTNTESSNDLKEKLAKLQAEAVTMGISPDPASQSSPYRNVHNSGYYGGWPQRGGGGPVITKRSLDNRPTKVVIKDIPQETSHDDLMEHFGQFGQLISLKDSENGMIAHYSQRFEAEKAMSLGSNLATGKLALTWYTNPPSSSSTV